MSVAFSLPPSTHPSNQTHSLPPSKEFYKKPICFISSAHLLFKIPFYVPHAKYGAPLCEYQLGFFLQPTTFQKIPSRLSERLVTAASLQPLQRLKRLKRLS